MWPGPRGRPARDSDESGLIHLARGDEGHILHLETYLASRRSTVEKVMVTLSNQWKNQNQLMMMMMVMTMVMMVTMSGNGNGVRCGCCGIVDRRRVEEADAWEAWWARGRDGGRGEQATLKRH